MMKLNRLKQEIEKAIKKSGKQVTVTLIGYELHIQNKDDLMVVTTRDNLEVMRRALISFAA